MRVPNGLRKLLPAALLWLGLAHAAGAPALEWTPELAGTLERAHASVVGVRVTVPDNAASAETIGRERIGSGVVIDESGLILTIGYLVLDAGTVDIVTPNRQTFPARALAYDLATGLGLIQPLLPLPGVRPTPIGQTDKLEPGEPVLTVSGGKDGQMQLTRFVSGRAFTGSWEYHLDHALYTSPPIGHHSGAALFSLRGELLGVGSLLMFDVSDAGGSQMPGNLFVPADLLPPIVAELRRTGNSLASHRPWLGVTANDGEGRVEVVRIARGSPAEAAGLQPGDLLLAVDGVAVNSLAAFYKQLWDRAAPDAEVVLTVLRRAELRAVRLRGVDRASQLAQPTRLDGI